MYATDTSQLPASWAEVNPDETRNGKAVATGPAGSAQTNGSSHVNGQTDSHPLLPGSFLASKAVRTVYGLVPLKYALDWPVSASYNELSGCASWLGGRIPTFEEARSIYDHVDILKRKEAERKLGKTVPAVNG
jgi:L-histidine Nalpha-methyltransferase / hercynylcysteine S-oxide synthase